MITISEQQMEAIRDARVRNAVANAYAKITGEAGPGRTEAINYATALVLRLEAGFEMQVERIVKLTVELGDRRDAFLERPDVRKLIATDRMSGNQKIFMLIEAKKRIDSDEGAFS